MDEAGRQGSDGAMESDVMVRSQQFLFPSFPLTSSPFSLSLSFFLLIPFT
jgi:hypothetical protein